MNNKTLAYDPTLENVMYHQHIRADYPVCTVILWQMGELNEYTNSKYKDYVYKNVSTGVIDKNKEHYSRCTDKAENNLIY